MAKQKKASARDEPDRSGGSSRTDRLLAILVLEAVGKKSDQQKAALLSTAGFANPEIASLLGTTPGTVKQHLYASRKAKGKRKGAHERPARAKKGR